MIPFRWTPVLALTIACAWAAPVPRHLLRSNGALTESSARPPREIGDQFTAAQMDAPGIYLANEYKTDHNGVTHLVYRQRFQGLDIHNVEWRVNIDRDGRVINAGGNLYPAPTARPANAAGLAGAARAALNAVNPILARESSIRRSGTTAGGDARFAAGDMGELTGRPVWYPIRGVLQPAFQFVVTDGDGISTYDTVIDAASEALLAKESLTMFQNAPRGSVYTGISPQPPVKIGVQSNEEPPYVQRVVVPFTGSPTASPKGWITGSETAGNNTITGANLSGANFISDPITAKSATLNFDFPLQIGGDAPVTTLFNDAVTTNLFYWVNRAHDLFYEVGFNEAAGNYQARNFSGAGVSGDPIFSYSQFGAQSLNGFASLNNAFFSRRSTGDGGPAMIAMFLTSNNGVWTDGSLSADVILHEYAHGVTFRLVPTMSGFQGGAMHEAFSDFWALEFLTPEGAPVDGSFPTGEYWSRAFGTGIRSRPYSTNVEINPLTYADLGRAVFPTSIHNDGGIWVMALWEIRANLIRQFGETEGRRRLRRIVIDGMKMAPPAPSMVDMRDAILLAERVDYKGESQAQMWEAFAKRGLGVLAYSPNSGTIQVTASFDKPSNTGVIGLQTETPTAGERLRITVYDGNYTSESMTVDLTSSSGDVETVVLRRDGLAYSGTAFTTTAGPARKNSGSLSLIRGDFLTVYYNDQNTGSGAKLVEKTIPVSSNYANTFTAAPSTFNFINESATGFRVGPGGSTLIITLPFAFPFYGKKYREVRVRPEGYLQFDTALNPPCLDEAGFANVTGISPLGMWMRTDGTVQPNQNVYTSRGPNTYTIRWAGETVPLVNAPPFTAAPEPVNFAVTLHENGQIQFYYGTGNQNLINRTPVFGCQGTSPVVGISRGIGNSASLPFIVYERVNFKDAPSILFIPPFENATVPAVRIDSPAPDAKATGVLPVRGIVYDTDTFVSVVHILIDGVFQGNATRNQPRADICAQERLPGCPNIGFAQNIDVKAAGLKPGPHTLQIRAVNAKGGFQDYPETPLPFTVEDGDGPLPTAVIETAKDGDVWKGMVALRGYAYSAASRVTAVDVIIDDIVYSRAMYGQPRADICGADAAGAPNCPAIGWQTMLNTTAAIPALRNGEHRLQVRITEDSGRISYRPESPLKVTVDNPANEPPKGVVTEPTNLQRVSGMLTISGHAWDPDGRIASVFLLIDGVQRGAAIRYGLPRPEACAALADVAACPNIGFEGTYDTRTLSNGAHRLGAILRDDAGRAVIIPGLTTAGMNIIVDNP